MANDRLADGRVPISKPKQMFNALADDSKNRIRREIRASVAGTRADVLRRELFLGNAPEMNGKRLNPIDHAMPKLEQIALPLLGGTGGEVPSGRRSAENIEIMLWQHA